MPAYTYFNNSIHKIVSVGLMSKILAISVYICVSMYWYLSISMSLSINFKITTNPLK